MQEFATESRVSRDSGKRATCDGPEGGRNLMVPRSEALEKVQVVTRNISFCVSGCGWR